MTAQLGTFLVDDAVTHHLRLGGTALLLFAALFVAAKLRWRGGEDNAPGDSGLD